MDINKWLPVYNILASCDLQINYLFIIYFNIFIQDRKFSKAVFQLGPVS